MRFFLDHLTFSVICIPSPRGESNYDDDNTNWQSENHVQRRRAQGCAFVECILNENRCHKAEEQREKSKNHAAKNNQRSTLLLNGRRR